MAIRLGISNDPQRSLSMMSSSKSAVVYAALRPPLKVLHVSDIDQPVWTCNDACRRRILIGRDGTVKSRSL